MLALLPGEQPTWQEERGRFVRLGWRSALGRYLRDPRTWDPAAGPGDASRLTPDETDDTRARRRRGTSRARC